MPRANSQMKLPEPWRRRLYLPAYTVSDAARFAEVHASTVAYWHAGPKTTPIPGRVTTKATLPRRRKGVALSYLELIEVAVVATFRRLGVELREIRKAHDYCAQQLKEEYPFTTYSFATDGAEMVLEMADVIPKGDVNKLVVANQYGQLGWKDFIGDRFAQFVYEDDLAVQWRVGGEKAPQVVIDPKVSFGAPAVFGIPTWALKGRFDAGESLDEIADDFGLETSSVVQALTFEGVPGLESQAA